MPARLSRIRESIEKYAYLIFCQFLNFYENNIVVFFTLGCDLLFTGKTAESALIFIPSTGVTKKTINVPANKTCSFYFGEKLYAHYVGCDGAWKEISSNSVNESLEVTPGWNTSQLQLAVCIKGTQLQFMRTRFVTAYAQGVLSCLVTCAKFGEGVSLSVPSQLAV